MEGDESDFEADDAPEGKPVNAGDGLASSSTPSSSSSSDAPAAKSRPEKDRSSSAHTEESRKSASSGSLLALFGAQSGGRSSAPPSTHRRQSSDASTPAIGALKQAMSSRRSSQAKLLAQSSRKLIAESLASSPPDMSSSGVSSSEAAANKSFAGACDQDTSHQIATVAELVRAAFGRVFADAKIARAVARGDLEPYSLSTIFYPLNLRGKVPALPDLPTWGGTSSTAVAGSGKPKDPTSSLFASATSPHRRGATQTHRPQTASRPNTVQASAIARPPPLQRVPSAASSQSGGISDKKSLPASLCVYDADEEEEDDGGFAAMLESVSRRDPPAPDGMRLPRIAPHCSQTQSIDLTASLGAEDGAVVSQTQPSDG